MPLVRLILPVIAALALLVQPVATWAAAGIERDLACCCPDPDKCECHDHDGKGPTSPTMRRCDTGKVTVTAPLVLTALAPQAAPCGIAVEPVRVPVETTVFPIEDRTIPPEKPPF